MVQDQQLEQLPLITPLTPWDAVKDEPVDTEHLRALEGLPYYWKMSWGWDDVIIHPCGHAQRVIVDRLEDPSYKPKCPYKEWGACPVKQ